MACERRCFNRGCCGAARRRWPCILLLLALCVLGSGLAADEFNRYHYELGKSGGQSRADHGPVLFSFVSDHEEEELSRQRRATYGNPSSVRTVLAVSQEQSQQPKSPQPPQQAIEDNKKPAKALAGGAAAAGGKVEHDSTIGDIPVSKLSDVTNETLPQHNITKVTRATHQYYNSTFIIDEAMAKKHWVDIDNHPDLQVSRLLSNSFRRTVTVQLKFDFPFYGHKLRNITIATGGFLYTGEYVHSWLAATQYIAPLMATFDTRLSNDSFVKYADNGTALTVVWENIRLYDRPDAGAFTFQVTVHQNGDIVFVYSVIPFMVDLIDDSAKSIKIGLSDAYMTDRVELSVRKKTFHEYHRVQFNPQDIKNWSMIYLNALPTCLDMDNCRDCLTKVKEFDCKWCTDMNQCSTGTFRSREDWLRKGCDVRAIKDVDNCPSLPTTTYKPQQDEEFNKVLHVHSDEAVTDSETNAKPERSGTRPVDRNRYDYEAGKSGRQSRADCEPLLFNSASEDGVEDLSRQRRATYDKAAFVRPEPAVSQEQSQQPPQQQPTPQQPQQQPPPPQQPSQQPPQQPQQTVVNASNGALNVPYSTENASEPSTASFPSSTAVWTVKQATTTTLKPPTAASSPMNSPTKTPVPPYMWANQTMWNNVTNKSTEANKKPAKAAATGAAAADGKEEHDSTIGDISISKFSDVTNKTLTQHNITKVAYDTHQYYNSTFVIDEAMGKKYWVDLDNHPHLKVNRLLSQSYRRAATVKLKFDFPFYGHKVRNITIATGGFLYTGEYVHSWLAATQYIAPLMANFDTRLSNDSFVKYADNGTAFTVVWENVVLLDRQDAGAFTFQVTLHQNGDIVFVYSVIPLMVELIDDSAHPVKIGLSDAYIMDRIVFFVRRKTIYEYHRVNFNRQDIKNWTVIYLHALPTCLEMDNCRDCLTKLKEFDCKWCTELNQCSTGTFRSRQDWLLKGCDVRKIKDVENCPPPSTTTYKEQQEEKEFHQVLHVHSDETVTDSEMNAKQERSGMRPLERSRDSNMNMGVSGVIGILLVIGLVMGLVGWAAYAYRNPHSASGQMLIRYRPSQWSWRRGEARYTAATIHM